MVCLLIDLWRTIAAIVLVLTVLYALLMLLGVVEPELPP